jgi:DNA-binding transcriptional MocR family regulator
VQAGMQGCRTRLATVPTCHPRGPWPQSGGVSRTTATAAYEQLLAKGYLETRQGARAQVVSGFDSDALKSVKDEQPSPAVRLSDYGQRLLDFPVLPQSDPSRLIADFRYGDLAGADFPTLAWRKAINATLLHRPSRLRYDDPRGVHSVCFSRKRPGSPLRDDAPPRACRTSSPLRRAAWLQRKLAHLTL